jgi:hypothetical protein
MRTAGVKSTESTAEGGIYRKLRGGYKHEQGKAMDAARQTGGRNPRMLGGRAAAGDAW